MSDGWNEAFARLKRQYLAAAPQRVATLQVAVDALAVAPADAAAISAVRGLFHKLAGSGTTYGFDRVTELCRGAEVRCDALLDAGAEASTADVEAVRGVARELAEEFARAARDTA